MHGGLIAEVMVYHLLRDIDPESGFCRALASTSLGSSLTMSGGLQSVLMAHQLRRGICRLISSYASSDCDTCAGASTMPV